MKRITTIGSIVGGAVASLALGAGLLAVITTTVRIDDNETRAKPVTAIPAGIEVGFATSFACGPSTVWSSDSLAGRVFAVDLQPAIDSGEVYDGVESDPAKVVQICVRNVGTRPTALTYSIENVVDREVGLCSVFEELAGDSSCPATPTASASPGELAAVASLRMSPVSGCGTITTPTVVSFAGGGGTAVSTGQVPAGGVCRLQIDFRIDGTSGIERVVQADGDVIRHDLDISNTL